MSTRPLENRVCFDDHGAGDDVLVLLHGHPFDRTMWAPQIHPCTAAGWRVITPDLRGYGQDARPGPTRFEYFARDIADLLDELGVERIVLGGLSMGGQVAMAFHDLFPGRLRGLILADTSAAADPLEVRTARRATAERLLIEGMRDYAQEMLPKMIAAETITGRPDVARHVLSMMETTSPRGAAAALRVRADRADYVAALKSIEVPVLVVVGREDQFTPVAVAEDLEARIANSRLLIVSHAAHMPNLEQPAIFNSGVMGFLDSLRTARTR